jgi:hypothetical protein
MATNTAPTTVQVRDGAPLVTEAGNTGNLLRAGDLPHDGKS